VVDQWVLTDYSSSSRHLDLALLDQEILPLLLAPSPTLGAHAAYALSTLQSPDPGPSAQLRALMYAVRWEAGVRDLAALGGERWLDMAAGLVSLSQPAEISSLLFRDAPGYSFTRDTPV
jgi:hypothetical protein